MVNFIDMTLGSVGYDVTTLPPIRVSYQET
jgi:hypothetical protein